MRKGFWLRMGLFLLISGTLLSQEKTKVAVFPFENQGDAFYDWMGYGISHLLSETFEATGAMSVVPQDSIYEATLNPNVNLKNVYDGAVSPSFMIYQAGWKAPYAVLGQFRVVGDTTIEIRYKYVIFARRALTQTQEFKGKFGRYTDVYLTYLKWSEMMFADLIGWNVPIDRKGVENAQSILRKRIADYDGFEEYINKWQTLKHYDAAVRLADAKDYDRALTYFDLASRFDELRTLNITQNKSRVYVLRGVALGEENKEAAEKDFLSAIASDSMNPEAYYNLANIYKDRSDWEKAEQNFQKALTIQPAMTAAYINLGYIFGQQGDWQAALKSYQRAQSLDAKNPMIAYYAGVAYDNLGDAQQAKKCYEEALSMDSTIAGAHMNLGIYYKLNKDLTRARVHYQRAITYDHANAMAHRNLGILLMNNKKEIAQAVYHLEKTLELDPNQEDAALIKKNLDILKKKLPKKKKK